MKDNNRRALVAAYYLSRFDRVAVTNLGYENFSQAFRGIGHKLGVNPDSIKNMRDEFDPLHDNERVGWWQRSLRPSRQELVDKLSGLAEEEVRELAADAIGGTTISIERLLHDPDDNVMQTEMPRFQETDADKHFYPRGKTGLAAEEWFMKWHGENGEPFAGGLVDCRQDGCGYDFGLVHPDGYVCIEVKGLSGNGGGISFTVKEWNVALEKGEDYYLALVYGIAGEPAVKIVRNPAAVLEAVKRMRMVLQVDWSVPVGQIDL